MKRFTMQWVDRVVKRCPKSGRITGLRKSAGLAKILGPLLGAAALVWFLLRVIPKPSRVEYPCQKVAAGIATGFLGYLASAAIGYSAWRMVRQRAGQAAAMALLVVVGVAAYRQAALSQQSAARAEAAAAAPQVLTPKEGANNPLGVGQGIFPGRVVWHQSFESTKWDGQSGHWWDEASIDQKVVDGMFSRTLQSLTGTGSDAKAWDQLFRHYNRTAGRGDRGFRKGERIVVKLNCNADDGKPWNNNKGYPSPHLVSTLVRQLVEVAGVPGNAIVLTDPSRNVGSVLYDKVRAIAGNDYRQIVFEGQKGSAGPQRAMPVPDMNHPMVFDMPGGKKLTLYPPQSYADATYLINYALLRPHRVFGVTLAAKNHFGSVYDPEAKIFTPKSLHAYALWDYQTPNHHGEAHSHPVLLGHKLTGGKTVLYFLDGLYTSYNQGGDVVRWKTLDGRWFSSILMSQDPVAVDSVAHDLITTEPNLVTGNPSFNGNVDSYLHEAALADRPPSKTDYEGLSSLGVHEHWNNATEKKYSRNLGRKSGIELLALR